MNVLTAVGLGLWVSLVVDVPSASAQDYVCDHPLLENRVAGPWAYSQREDRCEGLYVEQVAGEALAIVSFTSAFDDFDHSNGKPLVVEWTAPGTGDLHRAVRHRCPGALARHACTEADGEDLVRSSPPGVRS